MSSINQEINIPENIIKIIFEQIIKLNDRISILEKKIEDKENILTNIKSDNNINFNHIDWEQIHYY